jgi:hypothetical protein
MDRAQANKTLLQTQLGQAEGRLAAAGQRQANASGHGLEAAAGEAAAAQAEVDRLKAAIGEVDKVIGQATATISNDIVKMARDFATHVGQATDLFDRKQAELEAKYRGRASTQPDAKGNLVTTLHGGLLNDPGMSEERRRELLRQLAKEEAPSTSSGRRRSTSRASSTKPRRARPRPRARSSRLQSIR